MKRNVGEDDRKRLRTALGIVFSQYDFRQDKVAEWLGCDPRTVKSMIEDPFSVKSEYSLLVLERAGQIMKELE